MNKVKSQYLQSQSILIFRLLLKQKREYKIAVKIAVQNCSAKLQYKFTVQMCQWHRITKTLQHYTI